jgi:formylglycine-generating enzyme required for sulfatase activity
MGDVRVVAWLVLVGGCTSIAGLDGDYTLGGGTSSNASVEAASTTTAAATGGMSSSSTSSGAVGGAGGSGGSAPGCPTAPGPKMIYVAHDDGDYCIDHSEVESEHYQQFLASGPSLGLVPNECGWKSDFIPRASGNQCNAKHYDPINLPHFPVACVDWCDAYAYCAWAGKRLCGRVGGGATPWDAIADEDESEWFNACSDGGALVFPYGGSYQPLTCVGDDYDGVAGDGAADEAVAVGAAALCVGGRPGLVDMSGNLLEWENSCDSNGSSESNSCRDRGGSFWDGELTLRCQDAGPLHHTRSYYNKNIGFRCCADPVP